MALTAIVLLVVVHSSCTTWRVSGRDGRSIVQTLRHMRGSGLSKCLTMPHLVPAGRIRKYPVCRTASNGDMAASGSFAAGRRLLQPCGRVATRSVDMPAPVKTWLVARNATSSVSQQVGTLRAAAHEAYDERCKLA